jgi:hypothetical protein
MKFTFGIGLLSAVAVELLGDVGDGVTVEGLLESIAGLLDGGVDSSRPDADPALGGCSCFPALPGDAARQASFAGAESVTGNGSLTDDACGMSGLRLDGSGHRLGRRRRCA